MTGSRLTGLALGAALALAGADAAAAGSLGAATAEPLPLVLKDGRITRVRVYTVPFAIGSDELLPDVRAALEELARTSASDCFLTAQAIGHVAPEPDRDRDVAAAHRLARARADRVQTLLVAHGLPQDAIASVWDWQFAVPESRVTLWMFELIPGEDCRGRPLAAADDHPEAESGAPPVTAVNQPTPDGPQASPLPVTAAANDDADGEDAKTTASADQAPYTPAEEAEVDAPRADNHDPRAEKVDAAPAFVVQFDVNSSYLPRGAGSELRQFLDRLGEGRYAAVLEGAVAAGDVANASPEQAARYNRWLAQRRLGRVRDWLERHAGGRIVEIEERLTENDPSRRVRIEVRRLP